MKTWTPRVARDACSLFTEAQCNAIESLELNDKDGPPEAALLAILGITLEHGPFECRDCGSPFNDADVPADRLCAACKADAYDDELMADAAADDELLDWENGRGV